MLRTVVTRVRSRRDRGVIAVMTAILLLVFLGFCAFAVDVGHWYLVREQTQKAADAAALAGVAHLPDNVPAAVSTAKSYARINGFRDGDGTSTVAATQLTSKPTELKVTVSTTVTNFFGALFGAPTTRIISSGTANYVGPVKMGSPCNRFGNDPDLTVVTDSVNCAGVTGHFWANVNSPGADKINGDPIQSKVCTSASDHCPGGTNTDYLPEGYYYNVVAKSAGVVVQLFDPMWVNTGPTCAAGQSPAFAGQDPRNAVNPFVLDASRRYAAGVTQYCTGDNAFAAPVPDNGRMSTTFTLLKSDGSADPANYSTVCTQVYGGYTGQLFPVLNAASSTYRTEIARTFRTWSNFCTLPSAGNYVLQVQSSNALANDSNKFSVRAVGGIVNTTTVSAREVLGMYSNLPDADGTTEFFLARIPSASAGQSLKIELFDVGDSPANGTIQILNPSGSAYAGCTASGVVNGSLPSCSFAVPRQPSPFNGRWQTVNVPIPLSYSCADTQPSACWVKLHYIYGAGVTPTDVTTWRASMAGQPIRLVQ